MESEPKHYKISIGDKIKSKYGASAGLVGVVVKIFKHPEPSIDAGFDPKHPRLLNFAVGPNNLVNMRLTSNEFEPINKTLHSIPKPKMN